ncbi:HIT family protein [Candidatus Saccharibacteria bacterium]|nr:HIT family protein [Candidatus Saccharibacteria bacterium]
MPTVFTKIINGEIPSYKIYEDEICYAFLDNNPETLGHTLVVPKIEVDKIYDLDEETYLHLFKIAKKLAKNMEEKLNARVIFKVIGVDVPHAHIHLIPYYGTFDAPSEEEKEKARNFEKVQEILKIN